LQVEQKSEEKEVLINQLEARINSKDFEYQKLVRIKEELEQEVNNLISK
jgi:hypothetical protein